MNNFYNRLGNTPRNTPSESVGIANFLLSVVNTYDSNEVNASLPIIERHIAHAATDSRNKYDELNSLKERCELLRKMYSSC